MRLRLLVVLGIAGQGAISAVLSAQVAAVPGVRVRVVDTTDRRTEAVGVFVQQRGDSVVLKNNEGRTRSVRVHGWQRVEVSVARKRHVVRNGLIGAASGALVLGVVALAVADESDRTSDTCFAFSESGCFRITHKGTPRETTAAWVGGYGAVLGGIIGGLTGLPRRDVWAPAMKPTAAARSVGPRAPTLMRFSIPLRTTVRLR